MAELSLVCQNCGSNDAAYCWIDNVMWVVFVHEGQLRAEADDHEENRPAARKLSNHQLTLVKNQLTMRHLFDCRDCGEDDCVRIV